MEGIILELLSFLTLATVAVFSFIISKKIKFPYTLFLVLVGTILAFASKLQILAFLSSFHLTPEVLFYIFLPTLLFEAGYNIKISNFLESIRGIFSLAIIGLIISTAIIGFGLSGILTIFGIDIPIIVSLLFGAIISATDPVAVIAMFKEYSAPKRLTLLFEGESLFNDGTAVAMFVVILTVIAEHNGILGAHSILVGLGTFLSMILLGIIFGLFFGSVFSKFLDYAKSENLQITLSLLVAHFTFLISEMFNEYLDIPVSAIVATVVASIIFGNYGRYKLTPRIEKYIDNFWEYFAFIANSMVFLLLGFLLTNINFSSAMILPVIVAIFVAMIARAVSVYFSSWLLKFQKKEEEIPKKWQHLLSWGSLRGALAITMVLLIPDDLTLDYWNQEISIKEFVMILVVFSIYFTLFVKGLTIGKFIKKLKLSRMGTFEKIEYLEAKILVYKKIIDTLKVNHKKGDLSEAEYSKKINYYQKKYLELRDEIKQFSKKYKKLFKKSLSLYAIGVEKRILEDIYTKNNITEKGYKKFLNKLENQEKFLETNSSDLKSFDNIVDNQIIDNILIKFDKILGSKTVSFDAKDKLLYYKALLVTSEAVIESLKELLGKEGIISVSDDLNSLIQKYTTFKDGANEKIKKLLKEEGGLENVNKNYLRNKIIISEREALDKLLKDQMISDKVKKLLENDLNKEIDIII